MKEIVDVSFGSLFLPQYRWRRKLALPVVLAAAAWLVIIGLILSHPVYVSNDSLNNYAHVWYASSRIWSGDLLPIHMPVLGHGDALTFPYGFLAWYSAALLRPLFGDWIVTLWLVFGGLGVILSTFWAFPELSRGSWPACVLLNPFLVEAVLLSQLPFLWAAAGLLLAVGCWRRGQVWPAAVLAGVAQLGHPPVIMPLTAILVGVAFFLDCRRSRLLAAYLASLLIAAPGVWQVFISPVVEEASSATLVTNLVSTLALRSIVVLLPILLLLLIRRGQEPNAMLLAAGLLLANVLAVGPRHDEYAWGALLRHPDSEIQEVLSSPVFEPGATYRLLRAGDGKVGMYQLIEAGGRLDSEFFPESISRQSWDSPDQYAAFLLDRRVDYVIIYGTYDRSFSTNEHSLLRFWSQAHAPAQAICTSLVAQNSSYDVYRIGRNCDLARAPGTGNHPTGASPA